MSLEEPIEADFETQQIKKHVAELKESLEHAGIPASLRMIKELAEELSNHYNVSLTIKEKGKDEVLNKKINIKILTTPDIRKWLDFK